MESLQRSRIGFLEALAQSQLLDEAARTQFIAKHQLQSLPDEQVARAFISHRLLTKFQARQLLAGRWRGLAFDGYRILDSLSCGGMGEVFLARLVDRNEQVAIKVLRGRFRENAAALQRFLLEAEILTTLRHPHLLRGLSWKFFDDASVRFPYLVLELIRGPNLYEWGLLHGTIPWPQACEMVRQAALALQHAHEAGYLHRDVKPGNMLLSPRGVLKVLDFGLAKSMKHSEEVAADAIALREDLCGLADTFVYVVTGSTLKGKSARSALQSYEVPQELIEIIEQLRHPSDRGIDKPCVTAAEVATRMEKWGESFQVKVDFPSLLEARSRARKQLSKMRGSTLATIKQPETPVMEPAADELKRLRQLLSEMILQLDQRRKEDLAMLEHSALTKRAYEEETMALQAQVGELAAALRAEQAEREGLKSQLVEQQHKHLAAVDYLNKQLKAATLDAQRYQGLVQELKRELEGVKLSHQSTVEQMRREQEQLRRELDARQREVTLTEQAQKQIRDELMELTLHAERLAALMPVTANSKRLQGERGVTPVVENPVAGIGFWEAYEKACRPKESADPEPIWDDSDLAEESDEEQEKVEGEPERNPQLGEDGGLSG